MAQDSRASATSAAASISTISWSASSTSTRSRRTVTQMDNMLFSNMTLNPQPLHIDRHFCEQETEWGQPLMNSLFTLGLMIGIQVTDMTVGTTIANLGMTDVKFPHPLFEGDTVHCTTEVLGKRESKSRPGAGIVEFHHRAYNQDNKLVAECQRQVFMRMRPRDNALVPVRSRRRRQEARQGDGERRRRRDRRSRGFDRAGPQGRRAQDRGGFPERCRRRRQTALACWCASTDCRPA